MKTVFVNRNIIVSIFTVMLLTYSMQDIIYGQEAPDTIVEFSDADLARKVREALRLPTGEGVDLLKIPKAELEKLTVVRAMYKDIIDLTGLEHATQLKVLWLYGNNISDITPLAQLTQLTELNLSENRISDITSLAQLTQLTELNLSENRISDITPLAQLTQLTELNLSENRISDITSLAQLTQLTELYLRDNNISDITPLAQLTQLAELSLSENQMSDVTPLVQLTQLKKLWLYENQIQDVTPLVGLVNLGRLQLKDNPISNTYPLSSLLDANPDLYIDIAVQREPVEASTEAKLEEKNLNGSVVTLTSYVGVYAPQNIVENAVTVSGITGITIATAGVKRVNDTQVTVRLEFDGTNIVTDKTLTFTVAANALSDYSGNDLMADISINGYIQGPWLWMAVPTGTEDENDVSTEIDSLASASGGAVTEADIAQKGVNEGDTVGQLQWRNDVIASTEQNCRKFCGFGLFWSNCTNACWENNLNDTLNRLGFGTDENIKAHTAYALIHLVSPSDQNGTMQVLSSDTVKVWLNGKVVYRQSATRLGCRKVDIPFVFDDTDCTPDPRTSEEAYMKYRPFYVPLEVGNNLLLVKVRQHGEYWGMRFKLEDAEVTMSISNTKIAVKSSPTISDSTLVQIQPASVASPAVGEQITFNLSIVGGEAVAGYQATVLFDTTALRYVSGANGDYLPAGAFFVEPKVEGNLIKLNAASLAGTSNGDGTLATLTFEVIAAKASTLTLSNVLLSNSTGETFAPRVESAEITESTGLKGDVNSDGTVNIADLVLVASNLGKTGQNAADVNGDGTVNIADLVLVAGGLGNSAAAPSLLHPDFLEMITSADVRQWLSHAQQLDLTDATSRQGVLFLQQLLMVLTPQETALLANYPNPFNPETWIPYHLAKDADVTLHIYAVNGTLVRTLTLGHQPAGMYQSRSRAAYWDGKNAFGEPIASGVYFYTLAAGDFTATRKMLIRK